LIHSHWSIYEGKHNCRLRAGQVYVITVALVHLARTLCPPDGESKTDSTFC